MESQLNVVILLIKKINHIELLILFSSLQIALKYQTLRPTCMDLQKRDANATES